MYMRESTEIFFSIEVISIRIFFISFEFSNVFSVKFIFDEIIFRCGVETSGSVDVFFHSLIH